MSDKAEQQWQKFCIETARREYEGRKHMQGAFCEGVEFTTENLSQVPKVQGLLDMLSICKNWTLMGSADKEGRDTLYNMIEEALSKFNK